MSLRKQHLKRGAADRETSGTSVTLSSTRRSMFTSFHRGTPWQRIFLATGFILVCIASSRLFGPELEAFSSMLTSPLMEDDALSSRIRPPADSAIPLDRRLDKASLPLERAAISGAREPGPLTIPVDEASDEKYLEHLARLFSSAADAPLRTAVSPKGRIAWVAHANKYPGGDIYQYAAAIAQISCYCSQHNIPFYLELADYSKPELTQGPMTSRHYVTEKHLKNHEWVMFADLDIFIADSRIDINYLLENDVDVILPDRENGEVCACAYIVRNSPGGFAFLRRWIEWGTNRKGQNGDNGDLLELLLAGTAKGGFRETNGESRKEAIERMKPVNQKGRNEDVNDDTDWDKAESTYAQQFLPAFIRAFSRLRNAEPHAISWKTTLFATSDSPSRIKVYKPFSGLIRTAGSLVDEEMQKQPTYGHFAVPGDFLMHAKNAELRITDDMMRCTAEGWKVEHWLSLTLARKQLAHDWPNFSGCHFSANGTMGYVC